MILDAAAHVLADRGPTANMSDVAAAAGIGRATLYRYFPSRELLLQALASTAVAEAGDRIDEADLESAPAEVVIERIVRALVAIGDRYSVLVREHVQADPAEIESRLSMPIRSVIQRGIESGALRADLPIEVLIELFGGVLRVASTLRSRQLLGLEETVAAVTSLFLEGARRQ